MQVVAAGDGCTEGVRGLDAGGGCWSWKQPVAAGGGRRGVDAREASLRPHQL